MPRQLHLTIEGKLGEIPFGTFVTVVHNSFDILTELDSAVSSEPRGSLEWFVSSISLGSLTVTIKSKSKFKDRDYSSKVAEVFVDGLAHIQKERTTPPYFSDYGLRKAQNVAKALRRNGAEAIKVVDIERKASAVIKADVANDLNRLICIRYQEVSSVEGRLDMCSVHGAPRFTIYHSVTQRSVRCRFPDKLLDVIKEGLARRVIVSGMVYLNYVHEPVKVDVENVTILPLEERLPMPKALKGIVPDFTGGKESGEYVRSLRE